MTAPSPPYPFRYLYTGHRDAYYNMGLDEALLEAVAGGASLPVLRFYGWDPPAVSVGYFQGLREEVNLEACAARGVDVVRRITGGGAVFHQAELTYSIIMRDTHPLAGHSVMESYQRLCVGIVAGLALLGLRACFAPVNDILVEGRKISGNAQTRRQRCLLQHGTILLEHNPDLMFSLLMVPKEKIGEQRITAVQDRVTSLKALVFPPRSFEEAAAAFHAGFRQALSLDYQGETAPSPSEDARAKELAREKCASPAWLFKR